MARFEIAHYIPNYANCVSIQWIIMLHENFEHPLRNFTLYLFAIKVLLVRICYGHKMVICNKEKYFANYLLLIYLLKFKEVTKSLFVSNFQTRQQNKIRKQVLIK